MPRQGLTCPGPSRVVSWRTMYYSNRECEMVLLSVCPPVTGFLSHKQRSLIQSMPVLLPARYGWTETLALCIPVSPPFHSWLHSSTVQHPCFCAKTVPLQTKVGAESTRVNRVAGPQCSHPPKHFNCYCELLKKLVCILWKIVLRCDFKHKITMINSQENLWVIPICRQLLFMLIYQSNTLSH